MRGTINNTVTIRSKSLESIIIYAEHLIVQGILAEAYYGQPTRMQRIISVEKKENNIHYLTSRGKIINLVIEDTKVG